MLIVMDKIVMNIELVWVEESKKANGYDIIVSNGTLLKTIKTYKTEAEAIKNSEIIRKKLIEAYEEDKKITLTLCDKKADDMEKQRS